jgi:hypothetical protein
MPKLYLIRHAESCSNIDRDDIKTLHDKPHDNVFLNAYKNKGLFEPTVMQNLRDETDKNGEYTSFRYHPSLSHNGVDQAAKLGNDLLKPEYKSIKADILDNPDTIYIASGTLRTVMTALVILKDKIKDSITNGEKLIVIYPHLNEAISSKVTDYIIKNSSKFDLDDEGNYDGEKIEQFLKDEVKADVAIPYEIIEAVILEGIKWLIKNKYLDDFKANDVLNLIDFTDYIDYCKDKEQNDTNINPYLQNVGKFKELLLNNLPGKELFVLFVHFKVIFNELKEKQKMDKTFNAGKVADSGDNASIWLETTNVNYKLTDIQLEHPGPKIRQHIRDYLISEDETICYVKEQNDHADQPDKYLTYNINKLYDAMPRNNSISKFTYFDPLIIKLPIKITQSAGKRKYNARKYLKTVKNKKLSTKRRKNKKRATKRPTRNRKRKL